MIKNFYYYQEKNINNVSVLLKNMQICIPMICEGDFFRASVSLREGKYTYKFMVNNTIRFNDPDADNYVLDENGEVWSECIVQDELEQSKKICSTTVKKYILSNRRILDKLISKREFFVSMDTHIYMSTEICMRKGIHSITEVWHRADGILYAVREHPVEMKNDGINKKIFFISLNSKKIRLGIWRIDIYVDGKKMISEYFSIAFRNASRQHFINVII